MADVVVLTKNTSHIAAGKEYRARAAGTNEHAFLAEMRSDGAYYGIAADTAKAGLFIISVLPALAGAEDAGIHSFPQLLNRFAGKLRLGR